LQQVGTGYAKWASVNFGLNFIDATMCLSPGTATPTADFPKFFQDGPGGSIDPSAGAAYTWTSNCHESFQLQSGSKGKVVVRGSGNQNTGAAALSTRLVLFCFFVHRLSRQDTTTTAVRATRAAA
jgi:hypothetical protein